MECLSPHTHFVCVCVSRVIFSFVDSRRQTMPPMSNTLDLNTHFHQQLIIMCHHCGMQERFFISRIAFLIDNQFVFFCLVCLFLFCLCESVTLECFVAIQFKCTILLTCEKKPKLILMCAQSFSRCIIGRHTKFPSKCHFHFHSN